MWQQILNQINPGLISPFQLSARHLLGSGIESRYYRLESANGHPPLFIRVRPLDKLDTLESEAFNLQQLSRAECIRLPAVIACGSVQKTSFIALEYLPGLLTEASAAHWRRLGQQLARLHHSDDQRMYGWDQDNYLGDTVQPNEWQKKWCTFFAEQRIGWQLQLAAERGIHYASPEQVISQVRALLRDHQPEPALLHGDLRRSRLVFCEQQPVLTAPASYYGDRETDLALSELFFPLPQAFYAGYQSVWPLPAGYHSRRPVYNLYHLLYYASQSGEPYITQCRQLIKHLLE